MFSPAAGQNGNPTKRRTVPYAHDAQGRLTAETAAAFTRTYNYQAGDSPSCQRRFKSAPSAITSTQTGPESSLTRTQRLTYGPGGLIESQLGSAAPTYPEADNVGTITAWTDEQGSVTQEPELDPFGELVGPRPNSTPSPVDQSPLTFTGAFGRQSLAGADLVKMGARAYDPELGAFISRDPVTGDPSEPARRAAYAYAFNGPGRYLDLDGRSVLDGAVDWVTSRAEQNVQEMSDIYTDPNASWLEKRLASLGGSLNALATCENLDDTLWTIAPIPGPGKLKGIAKVSSRYKDITKIGSILNVATNVGHREFEGILLGLGWRRFLSKDGRAIILTKDGAKYSLRNGGKSHPGWTAEFTPSGAKQPTVKIRLGHSR